MSSQISIQLIAEIAESIAESSVFKLLHIASFLYCFIPLLLRCFYCFKKEYEKHTYVELKKMVSELQIPGRSFLRRKDQLVDAIMIEPKLCSALCISGASLTKCNEHSNNQYCSKHEERYRLEKPDDCPVCMDSISSETETPLECGHWIHKSCLVPTNLHICPLCRQNMKSHEAEYVFGSNHQQRNNYARNYYMPFSVSNNNDNFQDDRIVYRPDPEHRDDEDDDMYLPTNTNRRLFFDDEDMDSN
jgi:hypothetical protein